MTNTTVETNTHHVVPTSGRWGVRARNSEKLSKIFDSKLIATAYAFDIAKNHDGGTVVIHDSDGKFKSVNITRDTSQLMTILRS